MIDCDNTEDDELLNRIVKDVVESYLKKKKIQFYTGEIDDISSL